MKIKFYKAQWNINIDLYNYNDLMQYKNSNFTYLSNLGRLDNFCDTKNKITY